MQLKLTRMTLLGLACAIVAPLFAAQQPEEFKTKAGVLKITPIMHASMFIEAGGQVVAVDPAMGNYSSSPKADLILITDIHPDHLVRDNIDLLHKASTTIIIPEAAKGDVPFGEVMKNGESKTIGAWTIQAVPMYNLKRGPGPGQLYHDKGRGNGYIVTYGGMRIYIAGDTEGIPEMRALKNIDVAFIPMNLPYTMPPEEAADAVKAFHPKVVYPYHYGDSNLTIFANALKGTGIDVRLRNWY